MKVGLIDVDGHNFPNLALMKISAWHKAQGDCVEWCIPLDHYDVVYQSKVFDDTYSSDINWIPNADKIIKGGTGYVRRVKDDDTTWLEFYVNGVWIHEDSYRGADIYNEFLQDEIEHIYPDYGLYIREFEDEEEDGTKIKRIGGFTYDTAYGFLTRGCPNACGFCMVSGKEGRVSHKVADLNEFWRDQKNIVLLDPNLLACRDRMELLDQLIDSKARVDFSQGLDIRLTNEAVADKLNRIRVKRLHFAWDNAEQDLRPFFERFTAAYSRKDPSRKIVYVLTNFNSTMDQNLYRIYTLRDLGYDPYVMVYDKPNSPKEIRRLQRWVNNRFIFRSCRTFDEYKG